MRPAFLLPLILVFAGCALRTAPDDDSGFASLSTLDAFVGCYRNCSDPSSDSAPVCLSDIIWPEQFTPETRPATVAIQKGNGSSLVASAITEGVVLKRSRFEAGKDFHFKEGRIELKREYLASGARQPGNPFIGVASSKTILGLDAAGQGRINQSTAFAGTGFLIVPVAGKASNTQRIERVTEDLCREN